MAWSLQLHADQQYVEACYTGIVSRSELEISAQDTVKLCRSNGVVRVLVDSRGMIGGHSLGDLYFLSDWLISIKAYRLREAVLLPQAAAASEHARFWESTCTNRGLTVRVFSDRETALEWLLRETPRAAHDRA